MSIRPVMEVVLFVIFCMPFLNKVIFYSLVVSKLIIKSKILIFLSLLCEFLSKGKTCVLMFCLKTIFYYYLWENTYVHCNLLHSFP